MQGDQRIKNPIEILTFLPRKCRQNLNKIFKFLFICKFNKNKGMNDKVKSFLDYFHFLLCYIA